MTGGHLCKHLLGARSIRSTAVGNMCNSQARKG